MFEYYFIFSLYIYISCKSYVVVKILVILVTFNCDSYRQCGEVSLSTLALKQSYCKQRVGNRGYWYSSTQISALTLEESESFSFVILGGTLNIDVRTQKDNQDQIENHTLQSMLLCKHKYNKDNKYNLKELERKVVII